MVLLCIRQAADADAPPFLCSALTSSPIQAVVDHVVAVHNLRLRLETARRGEVGEKRPRPDDDDGAAADDMLSAQGVKRKLVLSAQTLRDALEHLQPGSAGRVVAGELSVAAAELLFAGRTLQPDKLLCEYVGKNEKSQVQVQLAGSAVPAEAVGLEAPAVATAAEVAAAVPTAAEATADDGHARPSGAVEAAGAAARETAEDGATDAQRRQQHVSLISLSAYYRAQRGEPAPDAAASRRPLAADDEEDPAALVEEQVERLRRAEPVRAAMRDERLQTLLRHIDGAESREAALTRLDEALARDGDFSAFSEEVLRAIGHKTAVE